MLISLLKMKDHKKSKWSTDLVICPDNKFGTFTLEDAKKWMKKKYGAKKSMVIQLEKFKPSEKV